MSSEPQGSGAEPRRRGANWSFAPNDWYARLESSRWLRPAALVLTCGAVGALLAPELVIRSYPTQASLVGTPATENIKAPLDFDVVDEDSSARQRDDAVSQVRRIYDFDTLLADKASERIARAFGFVRQHLDGASAERGAGGGRAPHPQHWDEAAQEARPEFEKVLGIALRNEEYLGLKALRFDLEVEAALRLLVSRVQAEPIVANRSALEVDRARGLTVQRVPADPKGPRVIDDVDALADLDSVRQEMPGRTVRLLTDVSPSTRTLLGGIAIRLIEPNLNFNRADTELARADARDSVKPVTISIKKGDMLVRDGERFTRRHLTILNALRKSSRSASIVLVAFGSMSLVLVLILTAFRFASGYGRRSMELRGRDIIFLASLFVGVLVAARIWLLVAQALHDNHPSIPLEIFLFAMPVASGAMLARLVLRADVAFLFALVSSLALGLFADGGRMLTLYALVGSVTGVGVIRTISARSDLLRAGLWVAVAQMVTAIGVHLFSASTNWSSYLLALPMAAMGGIVAGFVALSFAPAIEWAFGYTTDLKLLELANLNHPALKELIVQAPGSYHHSVIVGALVEAAAESVGANPLLARVMAYYHDLGKGCNPGYFIENQRHGQNPHDKLKPSMSAMVIRRHVTDGLELAKRYRLGQPILAGIAEHHGTTLIQYFYHKAKEQAEEGQQIAEADYRYPGRKPQTREAALVMLGDSLEAASRSLADPTPARLQGLVNRIISHKFTDGQLEECDLTLRDLHTIAKSFSRVLNSIYHHRLEYPDSVKDVSGKKQNGDHDSKAAKRPEDGDGPPEEDRPDNLRRLGLS